MRILNLGCGNKTSISTEVVNIDWSIYLALKRNWLANKFAPVLLNSERYERFKCLPSNIMVHDLAKGIPFDENSIDVVYHSHVLEHLDQTTARLFLTEIQRVLIPGGIHRIVVPDFEKKCTNYLSHVKDCISDKTEYLKHDKYIGAIIEQCVRTEAYGTSQQKPIRRFVENILLGDARRRGHMHLWMYDQFNLTSLLTHLGYKNIVIHDFNSSNIPNWNQFGLDINDCGNEYKPESLYVEAQK
jgi:SAM-dependent methyltransferase